MKQVLGQIAELVIQNVSKTVLEKLQDNILRYTYSYEYYPNMWYYDYDRKEDDDAGTPTFEFYYAWKWKAMKKLVDTRISELFYDYSKMREDEATWLHASTFAGKAAENLMDILNVDGYTSSLMSGSRHFSKLRKPYWDLFIESMFAGGEITQMFDKEFKKLGIKYIRS